MPSVVHVVVTGAFAGVERHVSDVARESSRQGWDVSVVGGHPGRMQHALEGQATWLPGANFSEALRSLRRVGRSDLCHAHMTQAEAVSLAGRFLHRAPVVATRHFARTRGTTWPGRRIAPRIARGLAAEIAISNFVAESMERAPDAVIPGGVPAAPLLWRRESRIVLVLQRLEAEKDTRTALLGWAASGLATKGWTLRVAGEGAERKSLERLVESEGAPGVVFAGWAPDVSKEFAQAGMLLAPTPKEAFGLTVVEAMAAGVPVVAAASGGHLETVGLLGGQGLFPSGDPEALAAVLHAAATDVARQEASRAGRVLTANELSIGRSVSRLLQLYNRLLSRDDRRSRSSNSDDRIEQRGAELRS